MATDAIALSEKSLKKAATRGTLARVARYSAVRLGTLFVTVVIGVFLTIMIANMGGYVDTIMRNDIHETIVQQVANDPLAKKLAPDVRKRLIEERVALAEKRLGLNTPVVVRDYHFLVNALQLKLGRALILHSDSGSKTVRLIILERLPATLLLMGTSQISLFFASVFLALALSRRYGSIWDKLTIALTPSSAAPPWFYGIFLILIFAALIRILPFGGLVDAPPPSNPIDYALNVLKHLTLPASALFISSLFLSIYNWRTFFLIYSSEDYVDMAKAKGLTSRDIERRYILRPTLPTIITNFALLLISVWTGAIVTETVFQWPGLGRLLFSAIGQFDIPVIVGSTIIYAYLLAITVFLLDFVYALVDPRVKIGGNKS